MDMVKTESGYVSGTVQGEPEALAHVFCGIPYVAPAIGDFRWHPPAPVSWPWQGARECWVYSPVAP